jgi:hypothetical protein
MQVAASCTQLLTTFLTPQVVAAAPHYVRQAAVQVLEFGRALYRVVHCYMHRQLLTLHEEGSKASQDKAYAFSRRIWDLLTARDISWLVERGT